MRFLKQKERKMVKRERILRLDRKMIHQEEDKKIKKGTAGTEEYFRKRDMSCF